MWSQETISHSEGTAFERKRLRQLRSRSRASTATIWIGKEGVSQQLLRHVESQLEARELVKIKVQKSALEETETGNVARDVAASTGSTLVEVIGHTFTLYKKRKTHPLSKTTER